MTDGIKSRALFRSLALLLLIAVMLCAPVSVLANALGIPDAEGEALVALYASTDGDHWVNRDNWLTVNTPWHGVTVESAHVVSINLFGNNLTGPIPGEIGNLTNLEVLRLGDNLLSGQIPPEIGSLSNLWQLYLQDNQFSGLIPAEIGNLTNLQGLLLQANQLRGPIPSTIVNLQLLDRVSTSISRNALWSTDPVVLTFLEDKASDWEYTQTVAPTDLSAATVGQGIFRVAWTPIYYVGGEGYYEVGFSSVSGGPYEFLPQHRTADKYASYLLMDDLPVDAQYYAVRTVSLSGYADKSDLTSDLSEEVISSGTQNALGIPDSEYDALVAFYNATDGEHWNHRENWLTADTPWWGVEVTDGHVTSLYSSPNDLAGFIPPEIGDLIYIEKLHLHGDQLSGPIPAEIGNLASLRDLSLAFSQLSGQIPAEIGNLSNLGYLDLMSNELTGPIPPEIGSCSNLYYLCLGYNQLTGPLPAEIGNLTSLETLYLFGNQISGPIPPEIGNMSSLLYLSLEENRLSGPIPAEIGDLSNLKALSLFSNQLTGEIPSAIVNLSSLQATWSNITYNALWTSDPAVRAFVAQATPGWEETQTVPPTALSAHFVEPGCVVSWMPIQYTGDGGYYEVGVSTTPGGPYSFSEQDRTRNKSASYVVVTDAPQSPNLYFVVRAVTLAGEHNLSTLTSAPSEEVCASEPGSTMRIGQAKHLGDGEPVIITNVPVTMGWLETSTTFKAYIQEWDRSAGIAIRLPVSLDPGDEEVSALSLTGTMATTDGERYIDVSSADFALGEEPIIRPFGIGSLTGWKGIDVSGLYVNTWGKVIEAAAYTPGGRPDWFRLSDPTGEFKVIYPQGDSEMDDNRMLVPTADTLMNIRGVCSGASGEKTIYYEPDYEVNELSSHVGEEGWFYGMSIFDNRRKASRVELSGPGLTGWRSMSHGVEESSGKLCWTYGSMLPFPRPAAPAEYLFRVTESGRQSIYKGWLTGYMDGRPTNLSPVQDSHVSGAITFSWTPPPGPYKCVILLQRWAPHYADFGVIEAGAGSSYTYSGHPLEAGWYAWRAMIMDRDGNSCDCGWISFDYEP